MSEHDEPAFPVSTMRDERTGFGHQDSGSTWQFPGMTMRDYFAGKALQGFCAYGAMTNPENLHTIDDVVADAYAAADAMLKERAKAQASEPGERNE